jgi:hypothetical protein
MDLRHSPPKGLSLFYPGFLILIALFRGFKEEGKLELWPLRPFQDGNQRESIKKFKRIGFIHG